jgi:nitrite reductase/ring-hydroxylating ferredoxin subunit
VSRGVPDREARPPESGSPDAEARVADPGRRSVPRFAGGRVPDAEDPADGGRRAVAVGGRKFVIVRSGDERFACEDRCLHVGVRLSTAIQRDTVLECRWHHWKYDLRSGTVDADDSPFECFTTYPVRVDDGDLVIDPTPRTSIRRKRWDLDKPEQCGGAT